MSYPPGVCESDIPGFTPDDEAWEEFWHALGKTTPTPENRHSRRERPGVHEPLMGPARRRQAAYGAFISSGMAVEGAILHRPVTVRSE